MDGGPVGGLVGLLGVLAEHGEAIEADLLRWYHVDLLDLGTARLSWRRLEVLLRHLPRESWFVQYSVGDRVSWGIHEHLLALIVDVLQIGNWQYASAHSKSRVAKPERLPRPGQVEKPQPRRSYTVAEMRYILDHWSDEGTVINVG